MHQIIGLDCATKDKKVGLARASVRDGSWSLHEAFTCSRLRPAADTLQSWLDPTRGTLICIDAPLGWPRRLAAGLGRHHAGESLPFKADEMFRRDTDRFVATTYKKTPLDVGADRIARTAHKALEILTLLRKQSDVAIPLLWQGAPHRGLGAIEVYPAATFRAYRVSFDGYRKPGGLSARRDLLRFLSTRLDISEGFDPEVAGVDGLDAGACIVAGLDFLEDAVHPPIDSEIASREGWIWVRRPDAGGSA